MIMLALLKPRRRNRKPTAEHSPRMASIRKVSEREKLLTEMRERAELDGAPDAEVLRTQFWRANLLIAKGETQEAKTILKEAISATDSVRMPYDYARLWQSYVSINNGYGQQIEDYMRVKDNVKVFSAYHDTLNLALSIFSLGHISLLAEDAEQALKYLQKSDCAGHPYRHALDADGIENAKNDCRQRNVDFAGNNALCAHGGGDGAG